MIKASTVFVIVETRTLYSRFSFFLPSTMTTGVIKTITDKGFGFIKVEGSADVFFHNSACNGQFDSMSVGQQVSFDLEQGEKGPKAMNVVAAGAEADAA